MPRRPSRSTPRPTPAAPKKKYPHSSIYFDPQTWRQIRLEVASRKTTIGDFFMETFRHYKVCTAVNGRKLEQPSE